MPRRSAATQKDSPPELGRALRDRRKQLSLTMQQVADGAGLSVGFISQVERGIAAPSLASLVAISEVLGMQVGAFLQQPDGTRRTTRQTNRTAYSVPGARASYERVSSKFDGSLLHSVIVNEPPGHRTEPISHRGEELFFVLKGEITVEIEGEREILRAGDSIHFDSRRTHATWNHGTDVVSLLWCGTMDVFGDAPAPIHKETFAEAKDNIQQEGEDT